MSRTPTLWAAPILLVLEAACGGSSETPILYGTGSAGVVVKDVQVSEDN